MMVVGRLAVTFAAVVLGFPYAILGAASFAAVTPGGEAAPTCKAVTANYITHCLPQQCLRTSRTHQNTSFIETRVGGEAAEAATPTPTGGLSFGGPNLSVEKPQPSLTAATITAPRSSRASESPTTTPEPTASTELPKEPDTDDSLLDTANFLSFEEWKAQNLAKAGQSSENFEQRIREPRKDPRVIDNALDALGGDSEIELNFDFGSGNGGVPEYRIGRADRMATPAPTHPDSATGYSRSKDAGKTCKERFNYASFDCAATVHKTNPGCKGANSILVENKDSYMRNKCGQENKFFVVELCEDILVDTVVLANFEFFSSMFRTFRISVSDRYPVKQNGWKDLGTFEARNSRQVQAFLIENPLIWARYLRVELLTHYGNEFYCPVSLLRVHGTTMMEEFRHQEELARGDIEDDVREDVIPEAVAANIEEEVIMSPASTKEGNITESYPEYASEPSEPPIGVYGSNHQMQAEKRVVYDMTDTRPAVCKWRATDDVFISESSRLLVCGAVYTPSTTVRTVQPSSEPTTIISAKSASPASPKTAPPVSQPSSKESASVTPPLQGSSQQEATPTTTKPHADPSSQEVKQQLQQHPPPPSYPYPPSASPTTQESFFKTVHKRLSLLEQNSTLSLQYIEDQSRLLLGAFIKVEKRQMEKTSSFIEQLNSTFLTELLLYVRWKLPDPTILTMLTNLLSDRNNNMISYGNPQ